MERLRSLIFHNTLKRKVFSFILVVLISFISGYIYTFYLTSKINEQINQMFTISIQLNKMLDTMDQFENNIENYLSTKSSDSLVLYLDQYNILEETKETLDFGNSTNDTYLKLNDIGLILSHYLDLSDQAIEYKRARNTEKYLETYSEIIKYRNYIEIKSSEIENFEFKTNLDSYLELTEKLSDIQFNLFIIVTLLVILSFLFVYSFTTNVTQPIEELSERAEAIARGNYNIKKINGNHFYEAEVLKTTFFDMTAHINQYINELEDKVETENKLRISETEKLKMQNMLRQAELVALQSQINPHFLFNTLNAGLQLANIEGADRTASFLDDLSQLFRYNIQSMDNKVTLGSEIENVKKYYSLMHVRFGDQISIQFDIDKSVIGIEMPPLILQPLVENSIIHGFKNTLTQNVVKISVIKEGAFIFVKLIDNGEGIPIEMLDAFETHHYEASKKIRSGHTTGLGLNNVYIRLKNFYGNDDVLKFESEVGQYTLVTIKIPIKETLHV